MHIGNKEFKLDNDDVYIMGILNVTPDSFSDGGQYNNQEIALERAKQMIKEGAHIIDVGGESTRPGYTQVSVQEEIDRVVEVIKRIKEECDATISIDTYKFEVAKAAIEAGADMVNDIWGLLYDNGEMAQLIKATGVSICLMHNDIELMKENDMTFVINRLNKSIERALEYGIDRDKIIIDPGIGFAKSYENNLYVASHIDKLKELDLPILFGISNKSVLGKLMDAEVSDRATGNIVSAIWAIELGAKFLRVHDVKEHIKAIKVNNAFRRARNDRK
ncbi:MAG: dihydropteroate synthase [Lachnospiraceae bacterium]|nr:dihydropteroate synthase [Lachnospiraceae bacterium]